MPDSAPKAVAGVPRGEAKVVSGAARARVAQHIEAVRVGDLDGETVVEITASAGSVFAITYAGRREDFERHDVEGAAFIGDRGLVDGSVANVVQAADARLVLMSEAATRAALQYRGEESVEGELRLASDLAPLADRTGAAIALVGSYLPAPIPVQPADAAELPGQVAAGLVRGEVTTLDRMALSQLPLLIDRMRHGGAWSGREVTPGRTVVVDKLGHTDLRATLNEPRHTFSRELRWTAADPSANPDATAWLDVDVLASCDGAGGPCALLLVDRDAAALGELNLHALAAKHAVAVAVIPHDPGSLRRGGQRTHRCHCRPHALLRRRHGGRRHLA